MRGLLRRRNVETLNRSFNAPIARELPSIPGSAMRVLVICTANVSRSPLAAELLRHRLADRGVPVHVASAGVSAVSLDVDLLAVQSGFELGVDISGHLPRQVTKSMIAVDGADLVIGMTREHVREVVLIDSRAWERTFTLKELARRCQFHRSTIDSEPANWLAALSANRLTSDLMGADSTDDIVDPYRRSLAIHQRVAQEMFTATTAIVDDLLRPVARQ
jgi:protein-tyrosine phosphatase